MSGTNSVSRSGRVLPSILLAGGLTAAAWLLGAVLSTSASAEEAPGTTAGISETVAAAESAPDTEVTKTPTAKPAALSKEEPAAAPVETFSVQSNTPEPAPAPAPRKKTPTGGGLLGGLLGTVLNVVTDTVGTVTNVVDDVLTPGRQIDPDCPEPLPLDGVGKAILPILGNDQPTHSGTSATVSVTVTRPAAETAVAATAPENPPAAPETATAARVSTVVNPAAHTVQSRQSAGKTAKSDQQANVKAGGSSGGGQLPTAPSAPLTPTGTVTAGHDSAGGARHQLAVLTSDTNTTQLRLIGTSLDHEVDGAGRDAALPTTSPD
ncbi:hypothetical protein [Amycolatopsis sp. NPDC059657]|uniref:hypothetical protein n=1 Tax=Amycolatopsis sp. NPDC059657 TaxID=3346899 RepID=UPI00366D80FD